MIWTRRKRRSRRAPSTRTLSIRASTTWCQKKSKCQAKTAQWFRFRSFIKRGRRWTARIAAFSMVTARMASASRRISGFGIRARSAESCWRLPIRVAAAKKARRGIRRGTRPPSRTPGKISFPARNISKKGYTSPEHLAGTGTSAGGILISRAITERPDLFRAAICNVGCANAMRMEFTPNGPVNTPEFGTVKDETECKALYEMDGVAHVQKGVKYPALMGVG